MLKPILLHLSHFTLSPYRNLLTWLQRVSKTKKALNFFSAFAPPSIEMLNLWNDFRKVVKFIDENPWVKPMLERIVEDKNRGMR